MRRNWTITIVFDELVVKGEQAHQSRQIQMTPHQQLTALKLAILRCLPD